MKVKERDSHRGRCQEVSGGVLLGEQFVMFSAAQAGVRERQKSGVRDVEEGQRRWCSLGPRGSRGCVGAGWLCLVRRHQ